jgi:hypothetical protein
MKNIFILISILLFLSSCDKPIYHNIPKNEKPLLKDKDTVVFMEGGSKELDSFLIKRTDEYRIYDKNYYYENILVLYKKMGKSTTEKNIIVQQGTTTRISVDGYYFPTIYKPATHGNENTIDININGIDYQSVFVLNTTNFPDSLPNKVYYTHKYGIIRYDYSDGRRYELNTKIN